MDSNLLAEKDKQEVGDQRTDFPIMSVFKEHPFFTADDLRDKVENDYPDKVGIRKAVDEALSKLHKKKEEAKPAVRTPHVVSAKELIDEVVRQELSSHPGAGAVNDKSSMLNSEELKSRLHEKLDEISRLETKLFSLIRDVKGFLVMKKDNPDEGVHDPSDNFDSLISKRSQIPFNINRYRKNITLVENFVREALQDDFNPSDFEFEGLDGEADDKKGAKQGDTRDLLGKEGVEYALLKQVIPGEIEDIPVSSLEKEIDEDDSVASDNGITRDALVDSPLSSLDYKKVTGKRSRHYVS